MSEASGKPAVWATDAAGGEMRSLPAVASVAFAADPDPRGGGLLVVGVEEAPHRERLWRVPLVGEPVALSPASARVRSPAWSPDGAWVVYERDADLWRSARGGGEPTRLTSAENGSFEPSFGPAGIAFGTSRAGNAEVYRMAADGGSPERVTTHPRDDVRPRWSPDGATLCWLSNRSGEQVVRCVGGGVERALAEASDLAWSPDGALLALTVPVTATDVRIDLVDPTSGSVVTTIDAPGVDEQPAWSPDGRWIALSSDRDGDADIWVVRRDGTDARRVAGRQGADWLPRWVR